MIKLLVIKNDFTLTIGPLPTLILRSPSWYYMLGSTAAPWT